MNNILVQTQEEWLKVLGKGMITLPKKWRDELEIAPGDIIKAKKEGNKVVIEPSQPSKVPYRVYSDDEIDEFLKEDVLSKNFAQVIDTDIANSSSK